MRELAIDEIRDIQLEILKTFAGYCEMHGLRYFLDAGTLLGAVRHQGYIPWDDDIDICMPRCDYDKLMDLCHGKISDVISVKAEKENIYSYPKIIHEKTRIEEYPSTLVNEYQVYVDLFPKDGIPEGAKKGVHLCDKVRRYIYLHWFLNYSVYRWKTAGNPLQKIIAWCGRRSFIDKNYAVNRLVKLAKKYDFDESPCVATVVAGGMKNCVAKECFTQYQLQLFEQYEFRIPVGYDTYLKKLYGDYMTLPPKEKQVRHHNFKAYWLD